MPQCEFCGDEYDKRLEIRLNGTDHVFDCFECAIHALAPACQHCGCRIIGHGVEISGRMFCGASSADKEGVRGFTDRMVEIIAKTLDRRAQRGGPQATLRRTAVECSRTA